MELLIGHNSLTLTRDGSITPVRYDGATARLVTYQGHALVQFGPKGRAKVEAAIAEARPAVWEEAYGAQAIGDGWEFVAVHHDALGLYRRLVSPAVTVTITL